MKREIRAGLQKSAANTTYVRASGHAVSCHMPQTTQITAPPLPTWYSKASSLVFYAAVTIISMMVGNFPASAADKFAQVDGAAARASSTIEASNSPRLFEAAPVLLSVANPSPLNSDKDVVAARAAFDRRDLAALDAARVAISKSGHPLSAYVDYWWLSANLSRQNAGAPAGFFAVGRANEISAFLNANQETPLADPLRRDWLKVLGALDAWDQFEPEFAKLNTEDSEVVCHQWRYLLTRKPQNELAKENIAQAKSQIKAAWLAGKNSSENCYAAFQSAFDSAAITNENVWSRVRRAFEANQPNDARRSAAFATTSGQFSAALDRAVASASADPAKYLSAQQVNSKSPPSVEVFLFAITRLARSDAARAAALLQQNSKTLDAADQAYAWAQIGQYGAMQHDANALAWFHLSSASAAPATSGTPFELNDMQAGWKARAALRAGNWDALSVAIDAMSVGERRDSAWRYWQARAYAQAGNLDAAKPIRALLARENSFYGVLASEELGAPIAPNWQSYKPSRIDLERILSLPAMRRALALYRLEMKTEGVREWHFAIRNMNDRDLLAAAEIARQANIPDRAINAADRTSVEHDFTQRFPMPYRTDMQTQARAHQLDEAWMYGLIRQESRFMADAYSRVGAMGLMQLMPATARWVASRVGMKDLPMERVIEVPTNLNLGAYYLRHVLDDLGHPVLATAGYNAGPGRARRWRAEVPLEGAIYAETIPFAETRDYVKKVMTNAWFYARQMGAPKISLKEMMGNVPARSSVSNSAPGAVFNSSSRSTVSTASTATTGNTANSGGNDGTLSLSNTALGAEQTTAVLYATPRID